MLFDSIWKDFSLVVSISSVKVEQDWTASQDEATDQDSLRFRVLDRAIKEALVSRPSESSKLSH